MTKIVFLDAATLPIPLNRPSNISAWVERDSTKPSEILAALNDTDVVITNKVPLSAETLQQLPKLKYICVAASGYDCVDVGYCKERGIAVSNVPGYAYRSVAEHVIASIYVLRRQMLSYHRIATSRDWSESPVFCAHGPKILDVAGSTLGLIGAGAIGMEVARLAKGLGMNVILSERRNASKVRSGYTDFYEVLKQSDVISLHCPATSETIGLIGARELGLMKSSAVLVNTARGSLVDERALESALVSGQIAGAALDVLQVEPPHERHRFLTRHLDNLLLTPHVAWASTHGVETLSQAVSSNIGGYLKGEIRNRVA